MKLDYSNRHVVVTGGTGALGAAVVELLIDCGATVHIPARRSPQSSTFPLVNHERVRIVAPVDLADEGPFIHFMNHFLHCGHRYTQPADSRLCELVKRRSLHFDR